MSSKVRTRFAPSPTGYPHVGNIRTALFAWLFARHHGGTFLVRIEDTDAARKVEGAVEVILDGLKWLGLNWDEGPEKGGPFGPYVQSERLDYYRRYADKLIEEGKAYYCYCSPERLSAMREEQAARKQPPGYDRHCRELSPAQRAEYEAQGIKPVVRFKMPQTGKTVCDDIIRGRVEFENSLLDDFVLLKSDGYPTYHLANIVDDHLMEISHVLRAEEWLSSLPRHLLLYEAMGWAPPQFAHLPMILGPDRSKLSKRHGAVSVIEYREQGYLPEAMLNFLTLLGWALDDKTEIMSLEEIVRNFSLERVNKTAAVFNAEKLLWMNGVYLRSLPLDEYTSRALPWLERDFPAEIPRPLDAGYVKRVLALVQERAKRLDEVASLTDFFFTEGLDYEPSLLIAKKLDKEQTLLILKTCRERLAGLDSFDETALEELLRPLAEEIGFKAGSLFSVLRTAVSGRLATPPLFEMMTVLGKTSCLNRIDDAISRLA